MKRVLVAQGIAYLVALLIVLPLELADLRDQPADEAGILGLLFDEPIDRATIYLLLLETTVFLPVLLIAPLCWWIRLRLKQGVDTPRSPVAAVPKLGLNTISKPFAAFPRCRSWSLALIVAAVSLAASASISLRPVSLDRTRSARFGDLPPTFHDEYSYLFQAKTFLAGRVSFPSHRAVPEIFDQMHVLNEGRFASRYFPGVGVWIAPFLAVGKPIWGHWLAGALVAVLVFWIGYELSGNRVGLLAGLLTAISPAMGLFSNLLLSHHPTLVGLMLFILTFLRMMRRQRRIDALWAGIGLSFAMVCRPMTAVGMGLPFGLWFLAWIFKGDAAQEKPQLRDRLKLAGTLGAPLVIGCLLMFAYNRAITGSGWTTPYQLYTETYTPRHRYGPNNRVRGERNLGPKVIENYDRWAENLTPALAVRNLRNRLVASWQWTMGVVPLAMATVVFIALVPQSDRRWWLVLAAIVSLHAAHVPYWYDGIMHWHYVFESGPLWLLLFAGATQSLVREWRASSQRWMPIWWSGVVLLSGLTSWTSVDPVWPTSRVDVGFQELSFSRRKYAAFHKMIDQRVTEGKALVLIEPDPYDRHIDFVVNDPDLSADVLYGRSQPGKTDHAEIVRQFPDRTCYLFRATTGELKRLPANR